MSNIKKQRGEKLDQQLKETLKAMLQLGYHQAPISRSTLKRRLKLTSRSTLGVQHRAVMIENARIQQMNEAGIKSNRIKKRNGLKEQNEALKIRVSELEQQRDNLVEKIATIINGAQARGYNIKDLMIPILS